MSSALAEAAAPSTDRYAQLEAFLGNTYGLSLASYSEVLVRMLLARLPADIRTADLGGLARVVAAFSIGETMFMRHPEQFSALRRILPTLPAAREGRALRVWSAGCASGEEAYSLAAALWATADSPFEVIGSDMNAESIERAREGRYRLWSLRGVDSAAVEGWLRIDALSAEVLEHLRPFVRFDVLNLMQDPYPRDLDVVFCRNVFLYFREEAARSVLTRIGESLRPGGVLFLGYSDHRPDGMARWRHETAEGVSYLRRTDHEALGAAARPSQSGPRTEAAHASRVLPEPPAPAPVRLPALEETLALARGLGSQRAFDDSLGVLAELSAQEPLEVEPYVLTAMIAEEAGSTEAGLRAARRVCFLRPEEPIGHYLLASCLARAEQGRLAARRFRLALETLEDRPDLGSPIPYGEGLTGHQLRRLIDVRLSAGERC